MVVEVAVGSQDEQVEELVGADEVAEAAAAWLDAGLHVPGEQVLEVACRSGDVGPRCECVELVDGAPVGLGLRADGPAGAGHALGDEAPLVVGPPLLPRLTRLGGAELLDSAGEVTGAEGGAGCAGLGDDAAQLLAHVVGGGDERDLLAGAFGEELDGRFDALAAVGDDEVGDVGQVGEQQRVRVGGVGRVGAQQSQPVVADLAGVGREHDLGEAEDGEPLLLTLPALGLVEDGQVVHHHHARKPVDGRGTLGVLLACEVEPVGPHDWGEHLDEVGCSPVAVLLVRARTLGAQLLLEPLAHVGVRLALAQSFQCRGDLAGRRGVPSGDDGVAAVDGTQLGAVMARAVSLDVSAGQDGREAVAGRLGVVLAGLAVDVADRGTHVALPGQLAAGVDAAADHVRAGVLWARFRRDVRAAGVELARSDAGAGGGLHRPGCAVGVRGHGEAVLLRRSWRTQVAPAGHGPVLALDQAVVAHVAALVSKPRAVRTLDVVPARPSAFCHPQHPPTWGRGAPVQLVRSISPHSDTSVNTKRRVVSYLSEQLNGTAPKWSLRKVRPVRAF